MQAGVKHRLSEGDAWTAAAGAGAGAAAIGEAGIVVAAYKRSPPWTRASVPIAMTAARKTRQ